MTSTRQPTERKRPRCPWGARRGTDQQIRDPHHEFGPRDVVQVLIEVPDLGITACRQARRVQHWMSDEGQRIAVQRLLHKTGIDVDDPVAKTCIGACPAVVRLVGMEDVALARKAVPPRAPEAERLNARKDKADCIGVVAMRGKRLTMEVRLHAFDPFGARHDPDAIAAAFAQPFKTSPAARP